MDGTGANRFKAYVLVYKNASGLRIKKTFPHLFFLLNRFSTSVTSEASGTPNPPASIWQIRMEGLTSVFRVNGPAALTLLRLSCNLLLFTPAPDPLESAQFVETRTEA